MSSEGLPGSSEASDPRSEGEFEFDIGIVIERLCWSPEGESTRGGEGAIRGGGDCPSSDNACLSFLF